MKLYGFSSRIELNDVLKKMWELDERIDKGEELTSEEKIYYNDYLSLITTYYINNHEHWAKRSVAM